MNARSSLTSAKLIAVTFLAVLFLAVSLKANASEKVLYSFKGGNDGANPASALVADRNGNLYGTTDAGGDGTCDCGTVFMLSPPVTPDGSWTETILYRFHGTDGGAPEAAVVFGAAGNLYGTTASGLDPVHDGTVFRLSPPSRPGDNWTFSTLYAFQGGQDGEYPLSNLVIDNAGNLYGTTLFGGGGTQGGVVFEVSPPTTPGANWTETLIHRFHSPNDGAQPMAGLLMDEHGALYGTTMACLVQGTGGLVFKLSPPTPPEQNWKERGLYGFGAKDDGFEPEYIVAAGGAIYGVTNLGGNGNYGTVYQLTPQAGLWKETVLYSFQGGSDGGIPVGQLYVDRSGNVYGTTYAGQEPDNGTVFRISPPQAGGAWVKTKLHEFGGNGDGVTPNGGLIKGKGGVLYGTTYAGGASGLGVVYAITP